MKRIILIVLMLISLSVLFSCAKQVPPDDVGDVGDDEQREAEEKNKDCTLGYYLNDDGTYLVSVKGNIPTDTFYVPYLYKDKVVSDVRLEENITAVKANAFANPAAIKELIIGADVSRYDEYAFWGCNNLEKISFPFLEKSIEEMFGGVLPDSVKTVAVLGGDTLPDRAFANLSKLTRIELSEQITKIGASAFANCEHLAKIELPNTVTEIGNSAFNGCSRLSALKIPDSTVSIGFDAFKNCKALTEITLPDTVTKLTGDTLFYGCEALTQVKLPASLTAIGDYMFYECKSLESIDIPDGVTSVGNWAFRDCDTLKTVALPEGITNIGEGAFGYCNNLLTVNIPNGVTRILGRSFANCAKLLSVTIGSGVQVIEYEAFEYCNRITEVINHSTVSFTPESAKLIHTGDSRISIEDGFVFLAADDGGYLLGYIGESENITLPEAFSGESYAIYKHAFSGAANIGKLTIPAGVNSIGAYAFADCKRLVSVTLETKAIEIEDNAFSGCDKLLEVVNNSPLSIQGGSNSYGAIAKNAEFVHSGVSYVEYLYGYLFIRLYTQNQLIGYLGTIGEVSLPESFHGENYEIVPFAFDGYDYITEVTVPSSVTVIGKSAFRSCTALRKINISEGVKEIESNAFAYCKSLTDVKLPNGIEEIAGFTFSCCDSLEMITIPASVKSIGRLAFQKCASLKVITLNEGLISIGNSAFCECAVTELKIPNSVTSIGISAFDYCLRLRSITIGNALTNISDGAFSGCERLFEVINHSELEITAGSNDFGEIAKNAKLVHGESESKIDNLDGMLFITDGEGVNYLIDYVGKNTTLILPENYRGQEYRIADSAFAYRENLIGLLIPQSITQIGSHIAPESLRYVYYGGSRKAWENIVANANTNRHLAIAKCFYYWGNDLVSGEGAYWHFDKYGNVRIW